MTNVAVEDREIILIRNKVGGIVDVGISGVVIIYMIIIKIPLDIGYLDEN